MRMVKVSLSSVTPYSQSRQHETPKLSGETNDAHELRTRIARGARRGRRRLNYVRFGSLNKDEQLHCARNNTRLALIEDAAANTRPRPIKSSSIPDLTDVIADIKRNGRGDEGGDKGEPA
jgi:hypothetical protein